MINDPLHDRKLDLSELKFEPIELGPNEVLAGAVLLLRKLDMSSEGNVVRFVSRATDDLDFLTLRGMAETFRDIVVETVDEEES